MRKSVRPSSSLALPLFAVLALAMGFAAPRVSPAASPAAAPAAMPVPKSSAAPVQVAVVRLEGTIDDYTRDHFVKRFNKARATGAKTIVIDLDTYGGLVTAGLDISRFIKGHADVHTVAYVGSKAISAGALIALACDEIVMAPSAQIGDCAPISIQDGEVKTMGKEERAKAVSPILSEFRDSAARNGYDTLLVDSMVKGDITVRWVQTAEGDRRRFVEQADFERLTREGWTEVVEPGVPSPVDGPDTLLTVGSAAAVKLGLAKSQEASIGSLAAARNYTVVATFSPGAGDKVIDFLNNTFVRAILMILFAQCLYAALHAPGHGFAEVIAVCALALLVGVPLMTGYAAWWEIIVILIGVVLLALEIFVIPGFGVPGILGIVMILFGLVMTFVGSEPASPTGTKLPELEGTWTSLRNGLAAVVGAMVCSLLLFVWLRKYLPKLPYFNRLILTTVAGNIDRPVLAGAPAVDHGPFWPAVGAFGDAVSDLRPGGSVAFYDPTIADVRVLSVISATGYIKRGHKVAVLENTHNRVLVRSHDEA